MTMLAQTTQYAGELRLEILSFFVWLSSPFPAERLELEVAHLEQQVVQQRQRLALADVIKAMVRHGYVSPAVGLWAFISKDNGGLTLSKPDKIPHTLNRRTVSSYAPLLRGACQM